MESNELIHPDLGVAIGLLRDRGLDLDWLYANWWSGSSHSDHALGSAIPSLEFYAEVESLLLETAPDGVLVVTNSAILHVPHGQYLYLGQDQISIHRPKIWLESNWVWRQSEKPDWFGRKPLLCRIYVPMSTNDPHDDAALIQDALNDLGFTFKLKTRRGQQGARDQTVVWVEQPHVQRAAQVITECLKTFICSPPPTTLLYNGIGLADHPVDGESLGLVISNALIRGLSNGSLGSVCEQFAAEGISLEKPWCLNLEQPGSMEWWLF